ncbi:unnamed protein product [Urochloa humidicola]
MPASMMDAFHFGSWSSCFFLSDPNFSLLLSLFRFFLWVCELCVSIYGLIEERTVAAIVANVVESMNYDRFILTYSGALASEGGLNSVLGTIYF